LIPARGGSKGIPNKNIKKLVNKPLIEYTINAAREIAEDKDICVSTDSDDIIKEVETLGLQVPFKRPADLSTDTATTEQVINHALEFFSRKGQNYDVVVLLQPTSPFRASIDITGAMKLFNEQLDMVVSVTETKSNPYYVLVEENEEGYLEKSKTGSFTRRQDCPKVWEYNGAVYVINVKKLKEIGLSSFNKVIKYEMPYERSVDIDSPLDWQYAEFLLQRS